MNLVRLVRWLSLAAALDWLLGRTLSRSAIFMPKSPAMLGVYQAMVRIGQFAANLAALLAMLLTLWIAWRLMRRDSRGVAALLAALLIYGLGALIVAPPAPALLVFHLMAATAVALIAAPALKRRPGSLPWLGVLVPAAAVLAGQLHLAAGALPAALGTDGPDGLGMAAFVAGEALVVGSGFALAGWLRPGRGEGWIWAAAGLPALLFSGLYLQAPAISGVLAIWSTGLTLYLPWPLYTLSLWAGVAAMITALRREHPAGLGIVLLIAGGYGSQFSSQLLFSLLALCMFARWEQLSAPDIPGGLTEQANIDQPPGRPAPVLASRRLEAE